METKKGELVWFDIPVNNFEMAKSFYGELFGWKFEAMGPDYWLIKTEKGSIGGFRKPSAALKETEVPILYFAADKLEPAVDRAKKLGGTLVGARVDIPDNMGSFHLFRDKDKNLIGIWAQS